MTEHVDQIVAGLLAGAVVVLGLALADVSAIVTSIAGLAGLGGALAAERVAAAERGVSLSGLIRPPAVRYVLIAFPFLFVVSAAGEEHLVAAVGAAVLTQAAYVRLWRATRATDPRAAGR